MLTQNKTSYRTSAQQRPQRQEIELSTSLETISPAQAKEWVKNYNDPLNRKTSTSNIKKYALDMKASRWKVTGESIKFDVNGVLVDGQHRLLACIDSGVPFESFIIRGVEADAKVHMDLGMKRTAAMQLYSSGILHGSGQDKYSAATTAAVLNLLAIKDKGKDKKGRHSTPEIISIIERHPDLINAIVSVYGKTPTPAGSKVKQPVAPPMGPSISILAAVYYVAAYVLDQKERADEFLQVFRTGVPNYENDPAHKWRERLLRKKGETLKSSVNRKDQLAGTCHAWNLFNKRIAMAHLRIPDEITIDGLDVDRI